MPDLRDLGFMKKERHEHVRPHIEHGIIARTATDFTDEVEVILPDFDNAMTWGPCRWQPQNSTDLPNEGDECLVAFSNRRELWIVAWWTGTNPTPGVPAGVVMSFAGAAAPGGYLMCNGAAVSRSTYARLFAAIGTVHGAGDGSTTFNLPNLNGRIPVGKDSATFATLGATGGEETHVLTTPEIPSHTHVFTGTVMAGHAHTFTGAAMGTHGHTFTGTAVTSGSENANHSHSVTPTGETIVAVVYDSNYTRSGTGKGLADIGGLSGGTGTTTQLHSPFNATGASVGTQSANHQHSVTAAGTINSVSAGTPSGTLDSVSAGTPAGTNANTGGGGAHNNLQPYIVLNYIIKV